MNCEHGGVFLVHPAKQHAYEVAVALQKAGRLQIFVTGIYYKPESFPYSLAARIPPSSRHQVRRELLKRTHPDLSPRLVHSWPYAELISRTIGHARLVRLATRGRSGYLFANWATDLYASRHLTGMQPRPRAVYAFLGAALHAFATARELTICTILDVPSMLNSADVLREEHRALGLTGRAVSASTERLRGELEAADWVVAPSETVADSVRAAGFSGERVFVVPFGADTSVFTPAGRRADQRRFRVVFAGKIQPGKGVHYLLEAWRNARFNGELVLAGPPGDEDYVARVRRLYGGQFVEAGNLTHPELAALLASADVFVLPSLAEGSALVTYEALASGLPCVVTREAGSVVRDGVEGFVIPARDSEAIRDRLERLYNDAELRRRMAGAALARSREFTWQRYHRELARVIDRVLRVDAGLQVAAEDRASETCRQ